MATEYVVNADKLNTMIRAVLDNVYSDWLREELDHRLGQHLATIVETAKDEATKAIAAKLLALVVKESMNGESTSMRSLR